MLMSGVTGDALKSPAWPPAAALQERGFLQLLGHICEPHPDVPDATGCLLCQWEAVLRQCIEHCCA